MYRTPRDIEMLSLLNGGPSFADCVKERGIYGNFRLYPNDGDLEGTVQHEAQLLLYSIEDYVDMEPYEKILVKDTFYKIVYKFT